MKLTPLEYEMLRQHIAQVLDGMTGRIFTPDMLFTFVARHPTNPECYVVVTNDTDNQAVAAKILAEPTK